MGKQRRQRTKFHIPAASKKNPTKNEVKMAIDSQPILMEPFNNVFAGININVSDLKQDLPDNKGKLKSRRSQVKETQMLSKKDKLHVRRQSLLKKIDLVNQMKQELRNRETRKRVSIIGATNSLHDALPTLEMLKCKPKPDLKTPKVASKAKGTPKALNRKKQFIQGVQIYRKLMSNKEFQKDPLKAVSKHISAVVKRSK